MKKLYGILALLLIAFLAVYLGSPNMMYKYGGLAERSMSGLEIKSVQVDDHHIVYLEGGQGETVLLIHGFGGDKDNWTRFARSLTSKYHVIALDLPGFGESTRIQGSDYGWLSQTERVHRFVEVLKLDKFHIAGNSMGGEISGIYAAEHPDQVLSVCLIDAAGVNSPHKSEFLQEVDKGKNPLLVNSPDDFDRLLSFGFVNKPWMPGSFKKQMGINAYEHKDFNAKIFADLNKDLNVLQPMLNKIEAPVLIMWGEKDRILDVTSVPVFEQGIKNHEQVIYKNVGHMPMLEIPAQSAQDYLQFIQKHPNK
ncbi:MAG: alpha/beta fold hydrolase [Candidatus Saccharibacteria bacterium]